MKKVEKIDLYEFFKISKVTLFENSNPKVTQTLLPPSPQFDPNSLFCSAMGCHGLF